MNLFSSSSDSSWIQLEIPFSRLSVEKLSLTMDQLNIYIFLISRNEYQIIMLSKAPFYLDKIPQDVSLIYRTMQFEKDSDSLIEVIHPVRNPYMSPSDSFYSFNDSNLLYCVVLNTSSTSHLDLEFYATNQTNYIFQSQIHKSQVHIDLPPGLNLCQFNSFYLTQSNSSSAQLEFTVINQTNSTVMNIFHSIDLTQPSVIPSSTVPSDKIASRNFYSVSTWVSYPPPIARYTTPSIKSLSIYPYGDDFVWTGLSCEDKYVCIALSNSTNTFFFSVYETISNISQSNSLFVLDPYAPYYPASVTSIQKPNSSLFRISYLIPQNVICPINDSTKLGDFCFCDSSQLSTEQNDTVSQSSNQAWSLFDFFVVPLIAISSLLIISVSIFLFVRYSRSPQKTFMVDVPLNPYPHTHPSPHNKSSTESRISNDSQSDGSRISSISSVSAQSTRFSVVPKSDSNFITVPPESIDVQLLVQSMLQQSAKPSTPPDSLESLPSQFGAHSLPLSQARRMSLDS